MGSGLPLVVLLVFFCITLIIFILIFVFFLNLIRVGWLNLANVRLTLGERKDKELLLDECSNGKNYGLLGVHVDWWSLKLLLVKITALIKIFFIVARANRKKLSVSWCVNFVPNINNNNDNVCWFSIIFKESLDSLISRGFY